MGYTRYYTITDTKKVFEPDFLETVKKLFELAQTKHQIELIAADDDDEQPIITSTYICVNGIGRLGLEACEINLNYPGPTFCKTAEKPYDAVIKALLFIAEQEGYITNVSSDGEVPESDEICNKLLTEIYQKETKI